jgi:homoserine dehydrogenase
MATYLTDTAIKFLEANELLQAKIAPFAGIAIAGINYAVKRNSKSLTTYKAVLIIAKEMGVNPDEILEELPN